MEVFFSGSSDVVLPEGGSRRVTPDADPTETDLEARAPYFCERCDESIPLAELASGRSRFVDGLPFCTRCAPLLEEERYQIYFCDRCGVSIPLERIEGGTALAGDGHIYCVGCRRRSPRVARRLALPGLLLVAALGVGVIVIRLTAPAPAAPPSFPEQLDRTARDLGGRLDAIEAALASRRSARDARRRRLEGLMGRIASLGASLEEANAGAGDGDESHLPGDDGR